MTTLQNKKVSVIVPNYNYARYIKNRINSIFRQTYPIHEIIILDDASIDGSEDIIKGMVLDTKMKNPEVDIRFVPSKQNSGKAMAQWKKGFELATGDYIWIAEADDLSNKRFLEEAMKGFDDPEVVLSYTESAIINSVGLIVAPNFRWSRDKEKTGHYKKNYIKDGKEEIKEIMAIRCTIPNVSAVLFKNISKIPYKKYIKEALGYSQVGDWYFYSKILEHGRISYNREALNKFRVHNDSKTAKAKNSKRHYQEILEMHKMFMKEYDLDKNVIERMKEEEKRIAKRVN